MSALSVQKVVRLALRVKTQKLVYHVLKDIN